jgi:NTE family protein
MTVDDFTDPVKGLIADAKARLQGKHFSDILDAAGNQYVDLVMGGGGVLGVALVGYTYALEELGVRFLGVGGTSAGSINALALAALGPPAEKKSGDLIRAMADMNVWSFVDGSTAARNLIRDFLHDNSTFRRGWDVARELPSFLSDLGLNPGNKFRAWLSQLLKDHGITTAGQLRARMRQLPDGLRIRDGALIGADRSAAELAVVAADISTETKAVLPRMAELYWPDPDQVDPALFVRASMSIPFFFEPLRVGPIPRGEKARQRWDELAGYSDKDLPTECAFVDGGVLSNFPINVFHDPAKVPDAPTFGVKLGSDKRATRHFDSAQQLTVAVFNSARHCLDYDFLAHNPDYRHLVCCIDTGTQSWLNFDLTPEEKIDLFRRGVQAAVAFLTEFDWGKYKEIRRGLAAAQRAAGPPPHGGAGGPAGPRP